MSVAPRRETVRGAFVLTLVATTALAVGCLPEPEPGATPTTTDAATSGATPTASSATPTATPDDSFAFPSDCEAAYTPEMFATLESTVPPLNDPGTTMTSTEVVAAIEVLSGAEQTIRCSWGPPSERGMATNVTVVTPAQAETITDALVNEGFSTEDLEGGTLHRLERETLTLDDEIIPLGETHYLRDDVWVSTRWITVNPDGYTEAIIASLWD